MYLGQAPDRAASVPLVLNLQTGNITAQWNVVFDDWFSTITADPNELPDFNADEWSKMFGTSTYCIPNDKEPEAFEPIYSIHTKQESDDPMFDKHIEQDIDISNPLTQPHQTYSEAAQCERQDKHDSKPPYDIDTYKSADIA